MILGKLKNDPEAQTNCANASPYFWEFLKKERTLFLFPKVIEIIAPQNEKQKFEMLLEAADKTEDDDDYYDYDRPFWIEDEDEWKATILECRLVCSAWNMAVEQCYQNATMAGIQELAKNSLNPMSAERKIGKAWTYDLFRFEDPQDIRHFLRKFQPSHFSGIAAPPKNPLFGRWIILDVTNDQGYKNWITKLLELYGKEVWYCCTSWYVYSTTIGKEVCSELSTWLGLMPNLKFLNVQGPEKVKCLSRKDLLGNPIPKLEKLEMLDFDETNGLILSEMLRVNNHVKVLRMANISSGVNLEVGRSLSNLKDFSPMPSKMGDKMLEQFGHHRKQLNKLYLVHASKYFGKMERDWGSTLTELDLRDPFGKEKATILRESRDLRLNLPGIRRLSVWIKGLFYLDFIKPMEGSLEHLEIIGRDFKKCGTKEDMARVKKEQSIELVGFEKRMKESNIWKLFGKLETVKMHLGEGAEFMMFTKEGNKYVCTFDDED